MRKRVYLYSYIPWFGCRRNEIVNKEEKAMSKAEKFIKDCTRNCSNEYWVNSKSVGHGGTISKRGFTPWLTPDQARRAVEIAREEAVEQTVEWLTKHAKKYYFNKERYLGTDELVEDYKLTMTDE